MAVTITTDPIMSQNEAQAIFDLRDTDEVTRLVNALSAKARAYLGRVQLAQNESTAITERWRGNASPTLWLHAPVDISDFDVRDLTVKIYSLGVLSTTYTASEADVVVTTDEFSARVDLAGGCFPECEGADFIEVTYFGGWSIVPADVLEGAVIQGRVDIKRRAGEAGLISHSLDGESTQFDQGGVIKEVRTLWDKYRMIA